VGSFEEGGEDVFSYTAYADEGDFPGVVLRGTGLIFRWKGGQ
jgi:hypothetical protein